jgi:endo-1,4-beta-xylanase
MSNASDPGLRELAERCGFCVGTCVSFLPLQNDPQYGRIIEREFDVITPENALKFGVLSERRGHYDFSHADAIVAFAEARNMRVRGHALLWYEQLPAWLTEANASRSELIDILMNHVATLVRRYAGRIDVWDVVNEAINADGTFRNNIWHRTIGPEYIDFAFTAARMADPNVRLFYNDYGVESTPQHAESVYRLLRDLRARHIPVDGVGLQMHLTVDDLNEIDRLPSVLAKLRELELGIAITEFDVRVKLEGREMTEQLKVQAEIYRQTLRCCLAAENCDTLVLWGFTDRHSWVPHFYPNQGAALLLDEEYQRKPAYTALASEFTRAELRSLPTNGHR